MPEIVSKWLLPSCTVELESEQRPFSWIGIQFTTGEFVPLPHFSSEAMSTLHWYGISSRESSQKELMSVTFHSPKFTKH